MIGFDYSLKSWAELAVIAENVEIMLGAVVGITDYRIKTPRALDQMKRSIRQVPVPGSSKKGARRPPVSVV